MSDNGFGTKDNSADYQLAVHRITPNTRTGRTAYRRTVLSLSDPKRYIPWTTWRDGGCRAAAQLPPGYECPAPDRILTGWDFDLESMQLAPDGSYWFGEEFGPFLLHTDAQGRLLEKPIPTPGVKSPVNPTLGGATANLPNSKGFEGMAIAPDGRTLYPLLEGAVAEDVAGRAADLRLYRVGLRSCRPGAAFARGYLRYRMESPANAIGDFILLNAHQGLVIERDNTQGEAAVFKRIYLIDLRDRDRDGYVTKDLVVDLMRIPDPRNIGKLGAYFTFPFVTIEDVEILGPDRIAVMNDNNFAATGGRSATQPDYNEYVEIKLGRALQVDPGLLG